MALVLDGTNKITATELADDAVTTAKMANDAVTTAKIADSAITGALLPAGSVLQVVSSVKTGSGSTTSSSYASSGVFATITPSSTSSKIFIVAHSCISYAESTASALNLRLYRGTSGEGSGSMVYGQLYRAADVANDYAPMSLSFTDSPSSTSALTYTVMEASGNGSNEVGFVNGFGGDSRGQITLMEIAG